MWSVAIYSPEVNWVAVTHPFFDISEMNPRAFSLSVFLVLFIHGVWGQSFVRETRSIPVTAFGQQLHLPFAGGINTPNYQFVDIDSDGDLDLVIMDGDLTVDFYRNGGTATAPDFELDNGSITFPQFAVWYLFLDYDSDGLVDMVTEDSLFSGVHVYKNVGTNQSPVFSTLHSTLLDSAGTAVFGGQSSIPAFADIDSDGDLDFFSSNFSGSINFYRNVGSSFNPNYSFASSAWESILLFGDSCFSGPTRPLHGASAYRFADIDGDGDQDFYAGDIFWNGIFEVRNAGTPSQPQMQCGTAYFPLNDPLLTNGLNQTSFVDIDNDGDLDMFVGVLGGLTQTRGFIFYQNSGTAVSPNLQRQQDNFLSMIDAGSNAHPRFVDIDADGDSDLFIGTLNGKIFYFENLGTATAPAFDLRDTMYQQIGGGFGFAPTFADVDGDGDNDLLVGTFDGRVKFYRNIGTASSAVFVPEPSTVDSINVGNWATPALVDIDGDGDLDLFGGKSNGRLSLYRNQGSPTLFQPILETTSFQNIIAGQNSVPAFRDIDGDGDIDLFIGTAEGRIEYYQNTGTPSAPTYVRVTNHFANTQPLTQASPSLPDIDGNGFPDLFVGTTKGGIQYYRNLGSAFTDEARRGPGEFVLFQNYPNPFNPSTRIRFHLKDRSRITLTVDDVLGRKVATLADGVFESGEHEVVYSSTLASGIYYYSLSRGGSIVTRTMVLIR